MPLEKSLCSARRPEATVGLGRGRREGGNKGRREEQRLLPPTALSWSRLRCCRKPQAGQE